MHFFKFIFFLVFTQFFWQYSIAQDLRLSYYSFPELVDKKYRFDPVKDYSRMMRTALRNQKKRHQKRYAEEVSFDKATSFRYGTVYVSWDEFENYLNEVLQKILPEEMKTNKKLRVYLCRSSVVDSRALHDPIIFLNIALFAELNDEAALANVLSNELAHLRNKDVQSSFFFKLPFRTKSNRANIDPLTDEQIILNDRKQERKADSLGAIWAGKAGYDLRAGIDNFKKFKIIENRNSLNVNGYKSESTSNEPILKQVRQDAEAVSVDNIALAGSDSAAVRPDFYDRITYYQNFIKKNNSPTSKRYLVSELRFKKLQEQAKRENLYTMLANFEYRECAEKAFVYYLQEPESEVYNYYILESIRRLFTFDKSVKDKGFLVDKMSNSNLAFSKGVLNNLRLIVPDDASYNTIKQLTMRDSAYVLFNTWGQAFDYFADEAELNSYTESLLTIALKNNDSLAMQNFYLDKYLSDKQKPRYKEFAEALRGDSLLKPFFKNKTKILLSERVKFIEDRKSGFRNRQLLAVRRNPKYQKMVASSLKHYFVNYQYQSLYNLTNTNLRKYVSYTNLISTSILLKKGEFEGANFNNQAIAAQNNNGNLSLENDSARLINNANIGTTINTKKPTFSFRNIFKKPKKGSDKKSVINQASSQNIIKYFIHDPEFWYLFKTEKLRSISYYNAVAFDDKTKLWHLLNAVNPIYLYWGWYTDLATHIAYGSNRFEFKVEYFELDPTNSMNEVYYYSQFTNYKLTPLLYSNGLYYAIKTKQKLDENSKNSK